MGQVKYVDLIIEMANRQCTQRGYAGQRDDSRPGAGQHEISSRSILVMAHNLKFMNYLFLGFSYLYSGIAGDLWVN